MFHHPHDIKNRIFSNILSIDECTIALSFSPVYKSYRSCLVFNTRIISLIDLRKGVSKIVNKKNSQKKWEKYGTDMAKYLQCSISFKEQKHRTQNKIMVMPCIILHRTLTKTMIVYLCMCTYFVFLLFFLLLFFLLFSTPAFFFLTLNTNKKTQG